MISLALEDVVRVVGGRTSANDPDARVTGVCTDSRHVKPGDLFIAIVGQRLDGHHFLAEAVRGGAAACIVSREACEAMGGAPAATPGVREAMSSVRHAMPGVPEIKLIFVHDPVTALGQLAAWYRREVLPRRTKVIGVTGSNGKTTTKLMMDHVLSAELTGRASVRSFNNAIGVPLTLLSAGFEDEYLVVEIGTNSPGEIDHLAGMAQPDLAVITSIGAAHLEGLGNLDAVAAEKATILRHVRAGGLAVVNIDEPALLAHLPATAASRGHRDGIRGEVKAFPGAGVVVGEHGSPGRGVDGTDTSVRTKSRISAVQCGEPFRLCTVGRSPEADLYVACIEGDLDGTSFVIDGDLAVRLRLPGPHHATNAALAYAVGRWMGLSAESIGERLYSFEPAAGRTRRVELGEVTLIDDCYNANPSSMMAALDILATVRGRRRVFVMGDMMELGAASASWHRRIGQCAAAAGVDVMIAAGRLASSAAEAAAAAGVAEIVVCDDACDAADLAAQRVGDGDVVLVKGSRAMGLEAVVQRLETALRPVERRMKQAV
ncbi:MAG: UDP-N-acetylmuramoyl-tripeptide--D-alanyl-D-alanine ligase [Phycisphaerales bacterium]|nr:UDP-N-acetylmuramoyl-tripeptide--D-alanyl-D-alanine ligase [Phycisphaerales bacterium]